jgi:hypothetical protein
LAGVFDFTSRAVLRVGAHEATPHRCRQAHRDVNHRQDVHHYQWVKPDLLARLISREGNQDRRVSLDSGISGMRITLKTHRFTTSYTITP